MYNKFIKFIHTTNVRACAPKVTMKKTLMTLLIVLSVALLCVAFVACDTTTDPNGDDNGHNQYEQAKYTVTFNVNSPDFKLPDNVVKDVVSGSSVEEPKNADGTPVRPIKTGYTFKWWSADGTNEFVFGTTPITKNTTITAIYTNNVYELVAHVDQKLVATKDDEGNYTYELQTVDTGASITEGTKFTATYDSDGNLDCPTPKENDEFVFWFYMNDDGKPVQLTELASSSEKTVKLKSKWKISRNNVQIYAMFKSTLPEITVEYVNSRTDGTIATRTYPVSESLTQEEADSVSGSITADPEYKFSKWYYVRTLTENDEEKTEKIDYVFKADDVKNYTTLYTASGVSDYFTPATIKMYAKFTKQIAINGVGDYQSKLYNVLHGTTTNEKDIEELLDADIRFTQDINFEGYKFQPLFDENHVFTGKIDGGVYDAESQLKGKVKLSNGTFGSATHASVFGYVSGTIENVDFENVKLVIDKADGKYASVVYMGYVASVLGGRVENCDVRITSKLTVGEDSTDGATWLESGMKAVYFGAIAARVEGSSSVKDSGVIRKCNVVVYADFACESLTFGGVCATSNSASTLEQNTATVELENVNCHDDSEAANGKSFVRIGGLVATNGGEIVKCEATIKIDSLTSLEEAYFGGVCADNAGSIQTTKVANATVNATVGGAISQIVCIGGMVGRNEGYILNSHCEVNFNITAQKANGIVAIGGIVGSNAQSKSSSTSSSTTGSGAVNKAYCVGNINVETSASMSKDSKVTLYVGGMIGRNAQTKKIANCFVVVGINVQNGTQGANHLGYMFGKHEQTSDLVSNTLYYATDDNLGLKLNGETYVMTGEDKEDQGTGKTSGTFLSEGSFTGLGKLLDFDISEDGPWKMQEGTYPTLR